jgi:predicted metalloprotease
MVIWFHGIEGFLENSFVFPPERNYPFDEYLSGGNMRKVYLILLAMAAGSALAAPAPVNSAGIEVVKKKLELAVPYFSRVWAQAFAKAGRHFDAPKAFAYTGAIQTGCGKLDPGNAYYCSVDKRIYLDAVYLAELMKTTAAETKTDGDYAAIVVAAHEFGHQLDHQLGTMETGSFNNEQHADCFAGAITREARKDRYLEPGDLEEARYALIIASDTWEPGGLVRRMMMRSRQGAHGSATDTMRSIRATTWERPHAPTRWARPACLRRAV